MPVSLQPHTIVKSLIDDLQYTLLGSVLVGSVLLTAPHCSRLTFVLTFVKVPHDKHILGTAFAPNASFASSLADFSAVRPAKGINACFLVLSL